MRSWARSYWRMFVWDLADLRLLLPVLTSILVLQGAGFVLGVGLLFRQVPPTAAVYVSTGSPVLNLLTAGLIFEPQVVADLRLRGGYDFLWSLPAPRSAATLAWYTVALVTALPAVAAALLTGAARYGIGYHVTAAIVPAVLAVSLTGTLLGYAIAHGIAQPMVARLVSVSMIFIMLGFSPIDFPAGQLPGWLASVNRWLPFGPMGTVMRAALVRTAPDTAADGLATAYLVIAVWAAVAVLVVAWTLGRRR